MPNHKASHSIAAQDAEVAELRASLARVTAERERREDALLELGAIERRRAEEAERQLSEATKDAERYREALENVLIGGDVTASTRRMIENTLAAGEAHES